MIVGVVVINAIIGFIQKGKAEKTMDVIRRMLSPEATVQREGKRIVVAAEMLVGEKVPADWRLLSVKTCASRKLR